MPTPGARNRLDGYSKRSKERALIADRRFNRLVAPRPGQLSKIHVRSSKIEGLAGLRAGWLAGTGALRGHDLKVKMYKHQK